MRERMLPALSFGSTVPAEAGLHATRSLLCRPLYESYARHGARHASYRLDTALQSVADVPFSAADGRTECQLASPTRLFMLSLSAHALSRACMPCRQALIVTECCIISHAPDAVSSTGSGCMCATRRAQQRRCRTPSPDGRYRLPRAPQRSNNGA